MHENFNSSIPVLFSFSFLICCFIQWAVKSGFLSFLKWVYCLNANAQSSYVSFLKGAGHDTRECVKNTSAENTFLFIYAIN